MSDNEELAAVPFGAVFISGAGTIVCRHSEALGVVFSDDRPFDWALLACPVEVIWTPFASAGWISPEAHAAAINAVKADAVEKIHAAIVEAKAEALQAAAKNSTNERKGGRRDERR